MIREGGGVWVSLGGVNPGLVNYTMAWLALIVICFPGFAGRASICLSLICCIIVHTPYRAEHN